MDTPLSPFLGLHRGPKTPGEAGNLSKIPQLVISRANLEGRSLEIQVQCFFDNNTHLLLTETKPASKVSWEMPRVVVFLSVMHFLFYFGKKKMLPNCSPGSEASIRRGRLSCLEIAMNNHLTPRLHPNGHSHSGEDDQMESIWTGLGRRRGREKLRNLAAKRCWRRIEKWARLVNERVGGSRRKPQIIP